MAETVRFTSEQREERLRVLNEFTARINQMNDERLAGELLAALVRSTNIEIAVAPAHPTPTVVPKLRLEPEQDSVEWIWLSCLAAEKANRQL